MKKRSSLLLILLTVIVSSLCVAADNAYILLQSTTSTKNSGLYEYLLPIFKADSGIEVRVVAVGTGQAIRNARNGDADVLIVHAKSREEEFVRDGFGLTRHELMYNDFVIVGPSEDPARIQSTDKVIDALSLIAKTQSVFVSRGDDSGTHIKELSLWSHTGINVQDYSGHWYREAGAGMGVTLNIAVAMNGYTLTDRSTWVSFW